MMKPEIFSQIAKIRVEVRRDGESRVGSDQLGLLCDREVGLEAQLTAMNEIAQWEHWDFEYLADGRVRFFHPNTMKARTTAELGEDKAGHVAKFLAEEAVKYTPEHLQAACVNAFSRIDQLEQQVATFKMADPSSSGSDLYEEQTQHQQTHYE